MRYRGVLVAMCAAALLPASVRGQCEGAAAVGDLGIAGIECNECVLGGDAQWRFGTEPRILRVEKGSAADGRLQVGDVITAVNGHAITTPEGARSLASIRPNQPVAMTVRRNGHEHHFLLRPGAACPTSPTLLGAIAPVQRAPVSETTPAGSVGQRLRAVEAEQAARAGWTARAGQGVSAVWIGIAFSCGECGLVTDRSGPRWSFRSPPEVYSVETGSPAYAAGIRRGDVLTHVNNVSITTPEGGRQWANLKPGETVRVRYRRGDNVRTAVVRAENPRGSFAYRAPGVDYRVFQSAVASRDSTAARVLRAHLRTLEEQAAEQERFRRELQEQLKALPRDERRDAERLVQEYLKRQGQIAEQTQAELERLRAAEERSQEHSRRALTQFYTEAPTVFVQPPLLERTPASEQRLRYSGTVRGTEVEVRSNVPVVVTEQGDEIVITTRESTVRVKAPRERDR